MARPLRSAGPPAKAEGSLAPGARVEGVHVEVAVTLPVTNRYTYSVPPALVGRAVIGSRVLVRFGQKKVTGVVVRERVEAPSGITPVDVSEVLDDTPALPVDLVELCLWVADYYEAPLGEVMRAALPAGSGESARNVVALTEAGRAAANGIGGALPSKQRMLLAKLVGKAVPMSAFKAAEKPVITALVTDGLVETGELRDKVRVRLKRERIVKLAVPITEAREAAGRSPKRYAVVEALAAVKAGEWLAVEELANRVAGSKPLLRALEKDGLVALGDREMPLDAAQTGESLASEVQPPP
nr:hypothetical protein [Deltaproteobacteria bacterium]